MMLLSPEAIHEAAPTSDATNCIRCEILMPIPGVIEVSEANPRLCTACAAEVGYEEAMTMSKILPYSRETAARWARWRREGKTYKQITELDEQSPSYPTIKQYMEAYGFDSDGQPVDGQMLSDEEEPMVDVSTPEEWGEIETDVPAPNVVRSPYQRLVEVVVETAGHDWRRIEAPSDNRGGKLRKIIKEKTTDIEVTCRSVGKKYYVYYRLANAHK